MRIKVLNITPRGQITLPKEVRNKFKTSTIALKVVDDTHAVISPIRNVGGSMAKFSKNSSLPFEKIRDRAWLASRKINNDIT